MRILGIDPGKSGGWALLGGESPEFDAMPKDQAELIEAIKFSIVTHVIIEKAQAMPGQGSVSMFNYGRDFGRLIGVVETLQIPYTLVHPRTWTGKMWEGTDSKLKPKQRSLQACSRLFPTANLLATERSKKPHEGIVDALLIAEYGRRYILGGS